MSDDRDLVLIVEDEPDLADLYATWLRTEYRVRVAYGGREALEAMDESVDAVLLDRRMPDVHGDDVLARIREQGYDCVVIMTTAVDPELNILAMDFDDYLCKPIDGETLRAALDQQLDARPSRDERLEEFFTVVSKLEVLEAERSPSELAASDEYEDLKERARELAEELDDSYADFAEIVATFRDINRGSS